MAAETWKLIDDYPNYEVSSFGQIRRRDTGRLRKLWVEDSGHISVSLQNPGCTMKRLKVHRLVAKAFIPNPEDYPYVRHMNDIPGDNRVENLKWGTNSDNQNDSIRNGTHFGSSKTECLRGHPYNQENTGRKPNGTRYCLQCAAAQRRQARKTTKMHPDDPRHGTNNGYSNLGCRCEPCRAAGAEHSRRMYEQSKRVLD